MVKHTSDSITQAFERGIAIYFSQCRSRIPAFCNTHFNFSGAWKTNRRAFGWDIIKAPINLFWAPIYIALILFGLLLRKAGLEFPARLLLKMPSGLTTQVQHYVAQAIHTELLCSNDPTQSLQSCIVVELDKLSTQSTDHQLLYQQLEPVVKDALNQYTITRTASADITNSLLSTIVGAFAFKKFTPGGFAIGIYLASYIAHHLAVSDFLLGAFFGKLYYALFPPTPSWQILAVSIAAILAILSILASFSGIISDPMQLHLGIHRKRLEKLVDKLEKDFKAQEVGGFRPKDQYVARILELVDAAKAQLF
ncbi:hypothetical protein NBRC116494_03160 [Aurantivibrio plasticivorans]